MIADQVFVEYVGLKDADAHQRESMIGLVGQRLGRVGLFVEAVSLVVAIDRHGAEPASVVKTDFQTGDAQISPSRATLGDDVAVVHAGDVIASNCLHRRQIQTHRYGQHPVDDVGITFVPAPLQCDFGFKVFRVAKGNFTGGQLANAEAVFELRTLEQKIHGAIHFKDIK